MIEYQDKGIDPLEDLYKSYNSKYKLANTYDEFKSLMQDQKIRKSFYDEFNTRIKLANDFDEFESVIGFKKKDLPKPSGSSVSKSPSASSGGFDPLGNIGISTSEPQDKNWGLGAAMDLNKNRVNEVVSGAKKNVTQALASSTDIIRKQAEANVSQVVKKSTQQQIFQQYNPQLNQSESTKPYNPNLDFRLNQLADIAYKNEINSDEFKNKVEQEYNSYANNPKASAQAVIKLTKKSDPLKSRDLQKSLLISDISELASPENIAQIEESANKISSGEYEYDGNILTKPVGPIDFFKHSWDKSFTDKGVTLDYANNSRERNLEKLEEKFNNPKPWEAVTVPEDEFSGHFGSLGALPIHSQIAAILSTAATRSPIVGEVVGAALSGGDFAAQIYGPALEEKYLEIRSKQAQNGVSDPEAAYEEAIKYAGIRAGGGFAMGSILGRGTKQTYVPVKGSIPQILQKGFTNLAKFGKEAGLVGTQAAGITVAENTILGNENPIEGAIESFEGMALLHGGMGAVKYAGSKGISLGLGLIPRNRKAGLIKEEHDALVGQFARLEKEAFDSYVAQEVVSGRMTIEEAEQVILKVNKMREDIASIPPEIPADVAPKVAALDKLVQQKRNEIKELKDKNVPEAIAEEKKRVLEEEINNINTQIKTIVSEARLNERSATDTNTEPKKEAGLQDDKLDEFLNNLESGKLEEAVGIIEAETDKVKNQPQTFKYSEIERIDASKATESEATLIDDARRILSAVGQMVKESTGQDLSITFHKSADTFAKAVEEAGGSKSDSGAKGFYLDSNGSIHINLNKSTPDTLLHEAFHPILDFLASNNPDIIADLHTQLEKVAPDFVQANRTRYSASGETTQMKEAITDFIANVASGQINIDPSNFQIIKNYIIELLNKIGLDISTDKIYNMKDAEQLKDLAKTISGKFEKGEEIKEADIIYYKNEEYIGREEVADVLQLSKDDNKKQSEKYTKLALKQLKSDRDELRKFPEAISIEIQKDKNGNLKYEIKSEDGKEVVVPVYTEVPYDLKNGALKYISKNEDKAKEVLANKIVNDYFENKDRQEISSAIGWYSNMRKWFQKNFGANIEMFGQLLAATSAQTPVFENFKQAVEANRLYSKGAYDTLLNDYHKYVTEINSISESELFNRWKSENPSKRSSLYDKDDYRRGLINQYSQIPLKENGKKYNANSKKVLQALYGNWLDQTVGPKTKNFAGNLTGRSFNATIDVWAARYLRRIIYENNLKKWRILPKSEAGVKANVLRSGEITGDYPFAEDVLGLAAKKIGINADDLQAFLWYLEKDVWDRNNWTGAIGKKKASFEEGAATLNTDRYQIGITTFKTEDTFDPIRFEKERERIRQEIGNIDGIIASRVTSSTGEYFSANDGIYSEPSFDIEFTVSKGSDITKIISASEKIWKDYDQESALISKIVDQDNANARPIIEIGLSKPSKNSKEIDDIKNILANLDIRGFTISRDTQGRILGIRSQFVPEFESDVSVENGIKRFVNAFEEVQNKYGKNENISYISTGFVDTIVKLKSNEAEEGKFNGSDSNAERGVQEALQRTDSGSGQIPDNRIETQEKVQEGGEGGDPNQRGYNPLYGMDGQSEKGILNSPQFSKESNRELAQDYLKRAFDEGKISKDRYDALIAKLDQIAPLTPVQQPQSSPANQPTTQPQPTQPTISTDRVRQTSTSPKQKTINQQRIERGLQEVEKIASEGNEDVWNEAKELVNSGQENPRSLAQSVVKDNLILSAKGQLVLGYDRMRLINERESKLDQIEEATTNGDSQKKTMLMLELQDVEEQLLLNDEALFKTGSLLGKAFQIRRAIIDMDYSLETQMRKLKVLYGGEVPEKVANRVRELEKKLRASNKRITELEKNRNTEDPIQGEINKTSTKRSASQDVFQRKILSIKDRILSKLANRRSGLQRSIEFPEHLRDIEADAKELMKTYIEEGYRNRDDIIDLVYADLQDVLGGEITRDETAALMTGYGKVKKPSQNQLARDINDITQQIRLILSLKRIEEGNRPLKSGFQRTEPSDEARRLRNELTEKLKNAGLDHVELDAEREMKTALDAAKSRIANQISDLENQIITGERTKPKEVLVQDQEYKNLVAERDRLKLVLDTIDGKGEMAEKQKQAENALKRAISKVQERIVLNQLENPKKDKLPETPEMIRLKEQLGQLNDTLRQMQDDAGIIERNKLDAYKRSLEKRRDNYKERLAKRDFSVKEKEDRKLDLEAVQLKAEVEEAKTQFLIEQRKAQRESRDPVIKAVDKLLHLRRELLLSSAVTMGKIVFAANALLATRPIEEVVGTVIKNVPGFSAIAKKAPRQGYGLNLRAERSALFGNPEYLQYGITGLFSAIAAKDMKRLMKGEKSTIEKLYGKKVVTDEDYSFFGALHAVGKYAPKQTEIFRSFEQRLRHAVEVEGRDISDPTLITEIMPLAILDGNKAIFMGDNWATDQYRQLVRSLESGKYIGGTPAAWLTKYLLPIVKVPTNYVAQSFVHIPVVGALPASGRLAYELINHGYKNLTPETADIFMKAMKSQAVGLAVFLLGYYNPDNVGGYYTGERDENDVEAGAFKFFDLDIPKWMSHTPLFETMHFGSTIRRLQDSYAKEGDRMYEVNTPVGKIPVQAGFKAGVHLIEEVPFLSVAKELNRGMEEGDRLVNYGNRLIASSLIPPDVSRIAKNQDVDENDKPIKREKESLADFIKERIPRIPNVTEGVWRGTLPEKDTQENSRKKLRELIRSGMSWRDIKNDPKYEGIVKKAELVSDVSVNRFIKEAKLPDEVRRFKDAQAEKQLKLFSAMSDEEKETMKKYLKDMKEFNRVLDAKPQYKKDELYNKAFKEIKEYKERYKFY